MNKKMLLLTIDGVSWRGLEEAVRSGSAPTLATLINLQNAGPLNPMLPSSSPAVWGSLATGTWPEHHGVVHPDELWAGGLRPTGRDSWLRPPVWQILSDQGYSTGSICFPFTRSGAAWEGIHIDDRAAQISGIAWDDWPLPPDAAPESMREQIRDLRIHHTDLNPDLLSPFGAAADKRRLSVALARSSTTFAIAQAAMSRGDLDFVAVHLDWPAVFRSVLRIADSEPLPSAAWALLDNAIAGLLGSCSGGALALISSQGTAGMPGFILACGSTPIRWRGNSGATIFDIAPTILANFGLSAELLGKSLIEGAGRSVEPFAWPRPSTNGEASADIDRVTSFGHALPAPPASWPAPKLLSQAELLLERDLAAAKALVAEALDLAPDSLLALGLSGLISFLEGEAEPLPNLADRIAGLAPGHLWESMLRAGYHVIRKETQLAAPFLTHIAAQGGPDEHLRAAGAWLMLDRIDEAERLFERVLEVQPDRVPALLGLASTRGDQPREVERLLRRVLVIDPKHTGAREALFRTLLSAGRAADAVAFASSN